MVNIRPYDQFLWMFFLIVNNGGLIMPMLTLCDDQVVEIVRQLTMERQVEIYMLVKINTLRLSILSPQIFGMQS